MRLRSMFSRNTPEIIILHRGPRYCVRFARWDDRPRATICFEYWLPNPSLDVPFTAEGFLGYRKTNAIGILVAENDWFQHPEIDEVLAVIRAATQGFDLIAYSGSMGAYASINFADILGLRQVIAVCPQYSIDASRAPYELRWRDEAARIAAGGGFARDRIDQVRPRVAGWVVYDPGCVDALHVADIQANHQLGEVRLRFGGHELMGMLQQARLYTDMLIEMFEGRFDLACFRRRWRFARRDSAVYWLGLSEALWRRGAHAGALRAAVAARGLFRSNPAAIDMAEAKARMSLGDHAGARRLASAWSDHPSWSGGARWCLAQLPAEIPDEPPAPRPAPGSSIVRRIATMIRG